MMFAYRLPKSLVFLCALLLLAGMLICCGCDAQNGGTPTTEPADTAAEPAPAEDKPVPEPETEAPDAEEPEPERDPAPDPDLSLYRDLVISKVYGNGGNRSAACAYGFIELTNAGEAPLALGDLSLYYRTADAAEYISFRLPAVTLNGGGSYLIRCGTDAASYNRSAEVLRIEDYDAGWEIALNGRDIRLVLAAAGRTLDAAVPLEELPGVISYLAASDGYFFDTGYVSCPNKNTVVIRTAMKQDSGYYLTDLTKVTAEKLAQIAPAAMNGSRAAVLGSKLREVKFSHAAGFYAAPLDLELSAPSGYGTIYYTTDGSDPTTSNTRMQYKAAIPLTDTTETEFGKTYTTGLRYVSNIASSAKKMIGAHVIKACATNGEDYTGVYTNSYFVSEKMAKYSVTVMSVSLETKEMFGNPGFYHNFNPSSNDPNTRGKAFLEVFDADGVRRGYSNVELAASGHGSSGTGMRSMKVFYKGSENETDGTDSRLCYDLFDGRATNAKGQSITDFSRLVLRNSGNDHKVSYIRDAYMQRLSSEMAADTMAYAPVLVFINGDFWGIYNARERYSGDYVESHYGIDKDNIALIESDYSQVHTNQNAPFIVTSGLEDDADDFNDLVKYIRKNDMTSGECFAYVESKLDLDSLIDLFVSRLYFSSLDFPGNNIKLWRNRAADDPSGADNRWHFVMLDMDMGISFYKDANNTTETSSYFSWLGSDGTVASSIIHKLLKNEGFKNRFLARFYQALNEIYVPAKMEEELDAIVWERSPIENLQSQRWGASMDTYNSSISDMRRFVRNRNKYALRFLCSYFKVSEEDLRNLGGNTLAVYFSETRLSVTVDGEAVPNPWIRSFEDSLTVHVAAEAREGYEITAILFTDQDGSTVRYEGSEAEITAGGPGEIRFETKKTAHPDGLSVRPGIVAGGCELFYLAPDGRLYAWGSNENNVLGAGESEDRITTPRLVHENVAQIEICHGNDLENGNNNIMAAILTLDGEIYVSGTSTVPGVDTDSAPWTMLEFDGIPVSVSVGYDHLLVLDQNGTVWGIGDNRYGQLGEQDLGGSVMTFSKIADGAVMISAGRRNTAYVDRNGDCYVLGDGRWHKFRDSDENITSPHKLLSGVQSIASGEHELLMVTEDGSLYYAGWRSIAGFKQGTGTAGAEKLSVSDVTKAAIHFGDIAILTGSGALYGYGINNGNCLGSPAVDGVPSLLVGEGVCDVAAGYAFIAYLDADGVVRVNGTGTDGQAGDGTVSEYVRWAAAKME
ncbi:MAG: CotH kinase family protein [Clostridia bacterium]|nr:CotH kinase family protein [Clostridia bacterium]